MKNRIVVIVVGALAFAIIGFFIVGTVVGRCKVRSGTACGITLDSGCQEEKDVSCDSLTKNESVNIFFERIYRKLI